MTPENRGFRTAAPASQQSADSQTWDETSDFPFQPPLHGSSLEDQARSNLARDKERREEQARIQNNARLAREHKGEEDADTATGRHSSGNKSTSSRTRPLTPPRRLIKKHVAGGEGLSSRMTFQGAVRANPNNDPTNRKASTSEMMIRSRNADSYKVFGQSGATKASAQPQSENLSTTQGNQPQSAVALSQDHSAQVSNVEPQSSAQGEPAPMQKQFASAATKPKPYDEAQRETALADIARRIGQKGMPLLDKSEFTANFPRLASSQFPDTETRQTADKEFWDGNDDWDNDDSSVMAMPPDLQAKIDQQKARLEEQGRLEAEKERKELDAQHKAEYAAAQLRAGVDLKAERQKKHAALLQRQKSLAEQRRREVSKTRLFEDEDASTKTTLEGQRPKAIQRELLERTDNQELISLGLKGEANSSFSDLSPDEEELLAKLLAKRNSHGGSNSASAFSAALQSSEPTWAQANESDQSPELSGVPPFDPSVVSQWKIFQSVDRISEPAKTSEEQHASQGSWQPALSGSQRSRQRADKSDEAAHSHDVFSDSRVPRVGRRRENRQCRICGQVGHIAIDCPENSRYQLTTRKRDSPFRNQPIRESQTRGNESTGDGQRDNASVTAFDQLTSEGRDALSSLEEEFAAETKGYASPLNAKQASTATKGDQGTYTERIGALDDVSKTTTTWQEPEEESRIGSRSRRFAEAKEDERPERKSRRRRQEEEEGLDEDSGTRRRGGRRSLMRAEEDEDDEDRPRRSRRRERDFEEESLDDTSALKRIRDRRQKEREDRRQRTKQEERRKVAIAAKRSEALSKIVLPQFITVSNLAQALGVKLDKFTRTMETLGFHNTAHDHVLSAENASLIALEFNFDPSIGTELEVASRDLVSRPLPDDQSSLPPRPPIVTIMGHVDHGKTTILDFLRKSSVAASEHGGITQHIGAFSVRMSGGKLITFLDTPGHAAFLSMRKRGANVTDIVILVVAADDSVKPQTLEALKHAREANVPIIVAVNKIDKPEADIQRVKQDLARHGVEIEDFGGDVQVVPVSGKTGKGMDDLEEAVTTLGEILDNRAEDDGLVEGWVLEATTKAAGRVATVLVRRGTLKPGSIIVAGQTWTRVRTLQNEAGVAVASAGPGTPVEVDGWRDQPTAGDMVLETETEQRATDVVDYRIELSDRLKLAEDVEAINEARRLEQEKRDREKAEAEAISKDDFTRSDTAEDQEGASAGRKEVPFIIKADVSGSAEAVENYLQQLINPICAPRILRTAVGPVSEFDVEHASAASGHIITFNLPAPVQDIASLAAYKEVKIVEQNVIYRLLEQVKSILEDQLEPTKVQRVTGEAQVLQPFDIGIGGRKKLRIAGSKVQNGQIKRSSRVRVLRNGKKVYDGTITSLKNVKKDVTEMRKGTECGIGFEEWSDAQEGDQIQAYEEITEKKSLPV